MRAAAAAQSCIYIILVAFQYKKLI